MNILNSELIRKSEESAIKNGAFSFRQLMHTAGTRAAEIISEGFNCLGKKVAVLSGNGNNGGDGFVIADFLYGIGADVTVITPLGAPKTENAKYYYDNLKFIRKIDEFDSKTDYDIIIDALFGIGYKVREDYKAAELFEQINCHKAIKISVDIPSGVESDSGKIGKNAVMADLTVTFIALKPCFVLPKGSDFCGEVVVADIGVKPISSSYQTLQKPIFKKRTHNSHKGTYGTALLVAGSYGMAGAAVLAAKAALRSGLGIAKCVLPREIYAPFTAALPEAVCLPLPQTDTGTISSDFFSTEELTKSATALLFGCGSGKGADVEKILEDIISNSRIPTLIDADGINALSLNIDLLRKAKAPIIITPHPGEMARLCNKIVAEIEENRIEIAGCFARDYGCIVVLKGANTVIATPEGEIFFNTNGNAGMATGGSGDVLSGIIVSLLAQGYSPDFAAKAGVYLHGAAADKAAEKRSLHAIIPSDIIDEL